MDIIIVGGGPSGIACAIYLGQNLKNSKITVLEHSTKICEKIYVSGNGRCNLTKYKRLKNFELTRNLLHISWP